MKTTLYTTALLITLGFATASLQGQSARQPAKKETKKQVQRTRTTTKDAKAVQTQSRQRTSSQATNKNSRSTYKKPAVQTNQNRKSPARTNTYKSGNKGNAVHNTRTPSKNTSTAYSRTPSKKTSTAYSRTPSKNMSTAYTRHTDYNRNKYSKKNYYGAKHYHYAYPTRKVKVNYHHDTYLNHFRVAYYPGVHNIYWSRNMYNDYRRWYPDYRWNYSYGTRIQSISIFDTRFYMGEVSMVYGRVYATWYNSETDDYLLFFGGDFPRQEFTVVIPGKIARKFSWRPERYFLGEHMTMTGLITTFDGSPEMVVKNKRQISLY